MADGLLSNQQVEWLQALGIDVYVPQNWRESDLAATTATLPNTAPVPSKPSPVTPIKATPATALQTVNHAATGNTDTFNLQVMCYHSKPFVLLERLQPNHRANQQQLIANVMNALKVTFSEHTLDLTVTTGHYLPAQQKIVAFMKGLQSGNKPLVIMDKPLYRLMVDNQGDFAKRFGQTVSTKHLKQATDVSFQCIIIPSTLMMLKNAHYKTITWQALKGLVKSA